MVLELKSSAFDAGGTIPRRHSKEGADVSPPLAWSGEPDGTRSFALLCDDPDAPRAEPWAHWVAWNIAPEVHELPEGSTNGANEGTNDFGDCGWGGPMPPRGHGPHRYRFHLYALDTVPSLGSGTTRTELLAAVRGHVLDEAELVGTYQRG